MTIFHLFITPHDLFQDGLLLLTILVSGANSFILWQLLRERKRDREIERGEHPGPR